MYAKESNSLGRGNNAMKHKLKISVEFEENKKHPGIGSVSGTTKSKIKNAIQHALERPMASGAQMPAKRGRTKVEFK
jgi:hypothetical protein